MKSTKISKRLNLEYRDLILQRALQTKRTTLQIFSRLKLEWIIEVSQFNSIKFQILLFIFNNIEG